MRFKIRILEQTNENHITTPIITQAEESPNKSTIITNKQRGKKLKGIMKIQRMIQNLKKFNFSHLHHDQQEIEVQKQQNNSSEKSHVAPQDQSIILQFQAKFDKGAHQTQVNEKEDNQEEIQSYQQENDKQTDEIIVQQEQLEQLEQVEQLEQNINNIQDQDENIILQKVEMETQTDNISIDQSIQCNIDIDIKMVTLQQQMIESMEKQNQLHFRLEYGQKIKSEYNYSTLSVGQFYKITRDPFKWANKIYYQIQQD